MCQKLFLNEAARNQYSYSMFLNEAVDSDRLAFARKWDQRVCRFYYFAEVSRVFWCALAWLAREWREIIMNHIHVGHRMVNMRPAAAEVVGVTTHDGCTRRPDQPLFQKCNSYSLKLSHLRVFMYLREMLFYLYSLHSIISSIQRG